MASKDGKKFEESVEASCKSQSLFYLRIRDVFVPPDLRNRIKTPKNKFDSIIFTNGHLFPCEFKSTSQKSVSFSESIIKEYQIKSLQEAMNYGKVIPGFIFNFRETNGNYTCFIHIEDFITYKDVAEGKRVDVTYKNKINKSSIPISICQEIGIEIKNNLKRSRYFYDIKDLTNKLIKSRS